jgi:opacity protein-like surface antigen
LTAGLSLALSSAQTTLELGVFYSPGGCILEASQGGETGKIEVIGTGVTVPVVLKLGLSPSPGPYVLIGGGVGYVLSEKVKVTADGETQEQDISEDINRIYYGVVAGAGFEFAAGSMIIFVEGRFNYGFSNMIKEPDEGDYVRAYSIDIMGGIRL